MGALRTFIAAARTRTAATFAAVAVFLVIATGGPNPVAAQTAAPNAAQVGASLASSGSASQSSEGWGGKPERAIDGNSSGAWRDGSITSTRASTDPWWEVNIGPVTVDQIVLWNRTDCCGERLNDAWVFVSDTPFANRSLADLKADKSIRKERISGAAGRTTTLNFKGAAGSYVRVQLEGRNRILSLAEVEVIGTRTASTVTLTNPSQSSTAYNGVAPRAVDGNTNGAWEQNSVTATDWQADPSWQAEFTPSTVDSVEVWNRSAYQSRLENAWVFVSDVSFDGKSIAQLKRDPTVHARQVKGTPSPSASVSFGGVKARYVRVQLEGSSRLLSLAEVVVIGQPMVSQSSTGTWGDIVGNASNAVDGNIDGNWQSGSVSHTAPGDTSPWWNIQLDSKDKLERIEILNRTDCCRDRLDDLTVLVSTTSANACTGRAEFSTTVNDFDGYYGHRIDARKLFGSPVAKSVCIRKNSQYLSMAEVHFGFRNASNEFVDQNGHFFKPLSDQYFGYGGWDGAVFTAKDDGADIIDTWANNLGEAEFATAFKNGWFRGNMYVGDQKLTYCQFERHVYPFGGDDVMNMIFSEYQGAERRRCGHHVSGYTGSDTFNFVGVDNVNAGKLVIGRINDFDVTRDKLQIDGVDFDPYNPPANVRFVAWNGDYKDATARPQIWIVITSKAGGEIFYGLEGPRYQYDANTAGNAEKHFVKNIPDNVSALPSIPFEDVHMSVPYGEYRNRPPGSFKEYYRYTRPEDGGTWEMMQSVVTGSDDPRLLDVIHGLTSQDYAYAGAGNDLIAGGGANDLSFGEAGNDKIWSGTEDDEAFGGPGDDFIEGNWGNDIVGGGDGNDTLFGNDGGDVLFGDHVAGGTYSANYWHITNAWAAKTPVGDRGITPGTPFTLKSQTVHQLTVSDDDTSFGASDAVGQVTKTAVQGANGPHDGIPVGGTATYLGYYNVSSSSGAKGQLLSIDVTSNYSDPDFKTPGAVRLLVFKPGFNPGPTETISFTSGLLGAGQEVPYSDFAELLESPSTTGGNDVLDGGAGNDELWGGPGGDTFIIGTNTGTDVIADFVPGTDTVRVIGANAAGLAISQSGNDAIAKIGSSSVRFVGQAGKVTAANFVFQN